jgi:membrane protease YdiL (CAAX protease family)
MSGEASGAVKGGFPSRFFLLTYAFSWVFWIPVIFLELSLPVAMLIVIFGAFGPSIMGVVLTHRSGDREEKRDFWDRFLYLRRIGAGWWLVILLIFPAIAFASSVVEVLLGGAWPTLAMPTATPEGGGGLIGILGFIIVMILGGPLAEELGWRGYALDRMQAGSTALLASLVLGVLWCVWHWPLFFMEQTSQGAMGFFTVSFWLWHIQVLCLAVIYTWVYNNNRRSTFSAFLLHFFGNTTFSFMAGLGDALTVRYQLISTGFHVAIAVAVVLYWGGRTMTRARRDADEA